MTSAISHATSHGLCTAHTMQHCMTLGHTFYIRTCGMTLSHISHEANNLASALDNTESCLEVCIPSLSGIHKAVVVTVASQHDIQNNNQDLEHGAVLIAGYKRVWLCRNHSGGQTCYIMTDLVS